jgi:hypothetical protein
MLYWTDQSIEGKLKISSTDTMSPATQPRKDPLHFYSTSPHLPHFQQSAVAIPLSGLSGLCTGFLFSIYKYLLLTYYDSYCGSAMIYVWCLSW